MKFSWKAVSRRDFFRTSLLPAIIGFMAGKSEHLVAELSAKPVGDTNSGELSNSGIENDRSSPEQSYSSRSAIAIAGNTASDRDDAMLTESGRTGKFVFSTADLSVLVAADAEQGVHIAPQSDPTGASGAWVRSDTFDSVDLNWFGAIGDGVADDTAPLQSASAVAALLGLPVSARAGEYRLSDVVTLATGLVGAGQDKTRFQAEKTTAKKGVLLSIGGSGIYEGFTVDGAVSRDPKSWNSSNCDSFTGWWPIEVFLAENIILRNITAQNSAQAGFRLDACTGVVVDNCIVQRSRNNFGDGFYIRRSSNISITNCKARDITRIGFVSEGVAGGRIEISSQISFTNCIAESAHDGSHQYGGGEYNGGFWSENSNLVTLTGCVARNTGDRGFTFAATALNLTNGFEGSQVSFTNCYTHNARTGYQLSSLTADSMASASVDGCVANECNVGLGIKRTMATINNFQYIRNGGNNTTMAIAADDGAHITINNLFTKWVNQGSFPASASSDSATISKFSSANPLFVKVSGARTHDDSPITIKHRVATPRSDLILENSNIHLIVVKCKTIQISNCNIISSVSGGVTVTGNSYISDCKFDLSDVITLGTGQGAVYHLNNCEFRRTTGTGYLRLFNFANTESLPSFFITNSRFVGDIEKGGKIIQMTGATGLAGQKRSLDLWLSNSIFVNTGSKTANVAIQLTRDQAVSNVFAIAAWKSSSIISLATWIKAGSVVNDFD